MIRPGDVVSTRFVGAAIAKWHPSVVITTDIYHANHPDVIVGLLTTRLTSATSPTDYVLQDWVAAKLHRPSAFRVYLYTTQASAIGPIGRLSDRDWREVQARLRAALAVV